MRPVLALYRVTKNDKGEEQNSEITQVDDSPERTRQIGGEFDGRATIRPTSSSCRKTASIACSSVTSSATAARTPPTFIACRSARPSPIFACWPIPSCRHPQQNQNVALASASVRKGGTSPSACRPSAGTNSLARSRSAWKACHPGVKCPGAIIGGDVARARWY